YAEISEILDLSSSAVETLIFRARRALREQLEGTLTCGEAAFAISRQLDGRLPRRERGQLRAHLRECPECASFARRQRAQRGALKTLALVPVPTSLTSLFGGGGAAVGSGLALKAAAAVIAGLVIGGAGYEGVHHAPWGHAHRVAAAPAAAVRAATEERVARPGQSRLGRDPLLVPKNTRAQRLTHKTPAHGRANGHGFSRTTYAGDAGVAARHVKVAHAAHAGRRSNSHA